MSFSSVSKAPDKGAFFCKFTALEGVGAPHIEIRTIIQRESAGRALI